MASEAATLGLRKRPRPASEQVRLSGRKLRCGTCPWRFGAGGVELLLIERLNEPGSFAFPCGTLEPGEEPSVCALRETDEEAGALGTLGCFLGAFELEKSRSYYFLLHVDHLRQEDSETWVDEHSGYACDGKRRRRWLTPGDARPLLRKEGPAVLDALLAVPPEHRSAPRWRQAGPPRIFLHGDVDYAEPLWQLCRERSCLVAPCDSSGLAPGQRLSLAGCGLWEADAAILVGEGSSWLAGLALGLRLPALLLLPEPCPLLAASAALRVEQLDSDRAASARLRAEAFLAALGAPPERSGGQAVHRVF